MSFRPQLAVKRSFREIHFKHEPVGWQRTAFCEPRVGRDAAAWPSCYLLVGLNVFYCFQLRLSSFSSRYRPAGWPRCVLRHQCTWPRHSSTPHLHGRRQRYRGLPCKRCCQLAAAGRLAGSGPQKWWCRPLVLTQISPRSYSPLLLALPLLPVLTPLLLPLLQTWHHSTMSKMNFYA